ncbi:MAG: hypothetical protein ACUVR6_10010, partial [Anaerolineae bacterium]
MLIGPAQRLRPPHLLGRHLGEHGHHQGLSNGEPATVWLTHILSEGNHRKSGVEDRAWRRPRKPSKSAANSPSTPQAFLPDLAASLGVHGIVLL